jgi:hypothetical protein
MEEITFDEKRNFCYGIAGIKKNDKWGFLDASNNIIIPFIYDNVSNFNDSHFAFVSQNGEIKVIDNLGKEIESEITKLGTVYPYTLLIIKLELETNAVL